MTRIKTYLLLLLISFEAFTQPITLTSTHVQTLLIELYSSEGCSSCPPADHFISQFKESDDLWAKYIPMVFHVDYWDYLGWTDVFATAVFSDRQRMHKRQGNLSSVYTPGFVINGVEWTGFFSLLRSLPESVDKPGVLTLTIDRHLARLSFVKRSTEMDFHLAILGMNINTEVKSGENAGHQLTHDFVVLNHQTQRGKQSATLTLPLITKYNPEQFAAVAWITEPDSLKPLQAVGGYLPPNTIKVL
ncbi:MAG: DUF1223 domain-containing protein [Xanthomonadales bacterium]|nr:DUF1223 domain-containing protein [Xanthomonadales bacterium]